MRRIRARMVGKHVYLNADELAEALRDSGYEQLARDIQLKTAVFAQSCVRPLASWPVAAQEPQR